ncbi:MAG: two-component system response regulator NarL [Methylibium sp.]|nr:two-component system response regulator NarL [Methylibium sp.]
MNTRILLIDDHPLFRKGLAQLVQAGEGLELAGDVSDGASGVALAQQLDPDLILVDLNMKPLGGIDTVRALKAAGVRARCIILTVSDDERDVLAAMRAGADGYLLKDMEPEELYLQLRQAAAGAVVLGSSVAGLLAHALTAPPGTPQSIDLTEREREILSLIARGLSNKEIARELGISDATVKVHIKHLLRKLNLKSRLEAAVWALQSPVFKAMQG